MVPHLLEESSEMAEHERQAFWYRMEALSAPAPTTAPATTRPAADAGEALAQEIDDPIAAAGPEN